MTTSLFINWRVVEFFLLNSKNYVFTKMALDCIHLSYRLAGISTKVE